MAEEASTFAKFAKLREETLTNVGLAASSGDVAPEYEHHVTRQVAPGTIARLHWPMVGTNQASQAWLNLQVAGAVQSFLIQTFAGQDEGLDSLYYKAPNKSGSPVSKVLWNTKESESLKLFFLGRVVTSSCGLATGNKQVCRLGSVPPTNDCEPRSSLFIIPTTSMTNPCGFDKCSAWMVRAMKVKESRAGDEPTEQDMGVTKATEHFGAAGFLSGPESSNKPPQPTHPAVPEQSNILDLKFCRGVSCL